MLLEPVGSSPPRPFTSSLCLRTLQEWPRRRYRPSVVRALRPESRGQVHIVLVPKAPHGIQAMEKALQQRWLVRLDAILARGQRTDPSVPRVPVIAGLDARLLSLGSGAWRTLAGHVRRFERLERDLLAAAASPVTRSSRSAMRFAVSLVWCHGRS